MEPSTPVGPEFNEAARYAMALNAAGQSLDLGPSISKKDGGFHLAQEETDQDVLKYYEEDTSQGIDLDSPDFEEHWAKIKSGYNKRVTDYGQLLADAGGEIAKIPGDLIEGVMEDGLVKGVASTGEGVIRSLRDLWGMAAESENPTSAVFGFKSVLNAFIHGKSKQSSREEAQQWNQARKFLYHSQKMMQGDESVLEQYIDMDEDTAKKVRSFISPKVAHAMSFIGMELPSIIAAPFTGGASASLAMAAAAKTGRAAMHGAQMANRASMLNRIGTTLTNTTKSLDSFAQRVTQRAVGSVATGVGRALEVPANIIGGAVGGTIDSIASKSGFSSGYIRNVAESAATDTAVALGGVAGGTRQTMGLVGSLGLRTTAELIGEIGNAAMMRSFGVIDSASPTSLTVLESVAANPLLSPSAKVAAKMLNTVVDPVIQLSTASLKHAYKDALTFSFLGYLNDRERGAVGGAAQGMMWGGYSGAIRHGWSLVNGGLSHDIHIKNFDESYLPNYIEKTNPRFANFVREVTSDSDASKSTRVMSQTRSVAQIMWQSFDANDRKNVITHIGNAESLQALLASEGISDKETVFAAKNAGGMFSIVRKDNGGTVPLLFLNKDRYRYADFGHEVLGHVLSYTLREKGKLGEHYQRFFGNKINGGAMPDDIIVSQLSRRRSTEMAVHLLSFNKDRRATPADINREAKLIMEGGVMVEGSKAYFHDRLKDIRYEANKNGPATFWNSGQAENIAGVKYMFEETMANYSEHLFTHTNLQNLILPDDVKPYRIHWERLYSERLAKRITDLEMAGVRAKYGEFMVDDPNSPFDRKHTIQAEAYDDGVWRRAPEYDTMIQAMVKSATSHDAQAVNRLSPAQQLAEAKLHKKEFLFNIGKAGATMKGTKELNDMSTKSATDAFEVFKNLDDSLKPEITLDEHGNQSVDMMRIRDEALDAMEAAGAIDPETARATKVIRDAYIRWESSGFATSNIFTGMYWGDSQRTIKNGFFQRLFGNDVSVTHRAFVPFEMKLSLKTHDAQGRQLRTPRGGMLMTVVDYMAIHRRKMKMWSRPDVRGVFGSINTFNNAFDEYLVNMMKDAGSRIPSAELFNKKFPGQGEKVRDMLYETFGGSIRKDESYFNAPREGYSSSHENPNYPIHSMRMELLVGLELTAGKPMPYHHGRAYEGLRRNYSMAGFERVNLSDGRFVNGQGYEIIKTGTKWKVFSAFGGVMGSYSDFTKASLAVHKDLSKRDLADLMPKPTEIEWADMTKSGRLQYMSEVGRITHQTYMQRMMEGKGKNMLSIASWDPKSDKKFVPAYKGTYQTMADAIAAGANLFKLLTDESRRSLDEWNTSNDNIDKYNPGLMSLRTVRTEGKNPFGPAYEHTGRWFTNQWDAGTNNFSTTIDLQAIEALSSTEEGRVKLLRHAIESSLEQQSAFFSKYGAQISVTVPTLHTITSVSDVYGYVAQSNALKFKFNAPAEFSAKRSSDIQVMKGKIIGAFGKDGRLAYVFPKNSALFALFSEAQSGNTFDNIVRKKEANLTNREQQTANQIRSLKANNHAWFNSNYKAITDGLVAVSNILDEMAYGDEAGWIDVAGISGQPEYAFSFKNKSDAVMIDAALRAFDTYPDNGRKIMEGFVQSHFISPLHALLQVVGESDSAKDASVMEKKFSRGGASSRIISAEYTMQQLGLTLKNPVNILFNQGKIMVVSDSGFVATASRSNENAVDAYGVRGRSETSRELKQPSGAMANPSELSPYSGLVRYMYESDAKKLLPRDVESLVHFGILEAAAIGMNPELEQNIKALRGALDSSQMTPSDRLKYSESLVREIVENGDGSLLGMAMAVHSLEKAREPSARIESLGRGVEAVANGALLNRFMHEALANWTMEMQRYWALGSPLSEISTHLDSIMGRKFYAEHGMSAPQTQKALAVVKRIREYHKAAEALYEKDRTASRAPLLSIADSSGLTKDQKDELRSLKLLKKVTIKGIETEVFELSDADSYVDYTISQGEPHLLPFAGSPDAEKAFADYQLEVNRRMTTPGVPVFMPRDQILGTTKLGKVFGHALLYKYFPQLRDIEVRFTDFHGGRAIRMADGKFIIEIGARALAHEKLALGDEPVARFDTDTVKSKYSGSNYITGLFVHEIQHILQKMGNILTDNRSIQGINSDLVKHNFFKILGIDYEPTYGYGEVKYGIADARIIEKYVDNPDAPVIASLRHHAKPLMRTATRNMMDFITFEHTAGRISDELFRKAESLHHSASQIDTTADAYRVYKEFMDFRDRVGNENGRYLGAMTDNKEFRVAIGALGLISNYDDLLKGSPDGRKVSLAKALNHYSQMEYVLDPVERQAFTTQQRRGLSQPELAAKDRLLAEDSSILEVVDAAMNKGLLRARELKGTTLFQSIAGIAPDASDNPAGAMFGHMSIVRFFLRRAHDELAELGRFVVEQEGWEIDNNGRLVLTSGKYIVKGDLDMARKVAALENKHSTAPTYGDANDQFIGISNKTGAGGKFRTYTIQDFAEIAGFAIEAEDVLSVGNSVIDIINSDKFPPMVLGGEISAELSKIGVFTKDAADAVMLDAVDSKMKDMVLTKNDLLNILTFNHTTFSRSSVVSGVGGIPDIRNRTITPDDFRKIHRKMAVQSNAIQEAMGHAIGRYGITESHSAQISLGRYKWVGTKMSFATRKPEWCPNDAWADFVKRFSASNFVKDTPKIFHSADGVERLNERVRRASLLIGPVVKAAAERIQRLAEGDKQLSRRLYAALLEDSQQATLKIVSGAEAGRVDFVNDVFNQVGNIFGYTAGSASQLIRRLGFQASNEAVFGSRGGWTNDNNFGWNPTALGVLFGAYIHPASESLTLASADVSEVVRPGANVNAAIIKGALDEGLVNNSEMGKYGDVMGIAQEEMLVHSNKFGRSGNFADVQRAFDVGIKDQQGVHNHLIAIKSDVDRLILNEQIGEGFDDFPDYLSEAWDDRFGHKTFSDVSGMSYPERQAFLGPIKADLEARISQLDAQIALSTKVMDVWVETFSRNDVYESAIRDRRASPVLGMEVGSLLVKDSSKLRGISLAGVFGMVAPDGKAIISLDADNADINGITSFRMHTSGRGIPTETMVTINRAYHNLETNVNHALFTMLRTKGLKLTDAHNNPTVFKAEFESTVGGFDRAGVLVEYLERFSEPTKTSAISLSNEGALAHYVGGNVLAIQSMMGVLMLENADRSQGNSAHMQATLPRIMSLFGENSPLREASISDSKKTIYKSESAVHVTHSALGAAVMPMLYTKLSDGIPTVGADGRVTLDNFGVHNDLFEAVTNAINENASPDVIREIAKDWINGIDKRNAGRMAHEMSANMATSGILTMLGLIAGVDFTRNKQLPTDYGYSLKASLNFGAAFGLDHNMAQHAALSEKVQNVGPGFLATRLSQLIESAMLSADGEFWIGYAISHVAMADKRTKTYSVQYSGMHSSRPYAANMRDINTYSTLGTADPDFASVMVPTYGAPVSMFRHHESITPGVNNPAWSGVGIYAERSYGTSNGFKYEPGKPRQEWAGFGVDGVIEDSFKKSPAMANGPEYASGSISVLSELQSAHEALMNHLGHDNQFAPDSQGNWALKQMLTDGSGYHDTDTDFVVGNSGVGIAAVPNAGAVSSSAVKRMVMTNRLAAIAKQLGKTEISTPAARFGVTLPPSHAMLAIREGAERRVAWQAKGAFIGKVMSYGGSSSGAPVQLHQKDYGKIGLSWKRLEDGRIMVNYSPDVSVPSTYDIIHDSDVLPPAVGIPLLRAVGWEPNAGTAFSQSIARRGLFVASATTIGGLSRDVMPYLPNGKRFGGFDDVALKDYLQGVRRLIKGDIYLGGRTHNKLVGGSGYSPKQSGQVPNDHRQILQNIIDGNIPSNREGMMQYALYADEVMHDLSPEFGYFSFVLPADAKVEDFNTAILNHYAASSTGVGPYSKTRNFGTPLGLNGHQVSSLIGSLAQFPQEKDGHRAMMDLMSAQDVAPASSGNALAQLMGKEGSLVSKNITNIESIMVEMAKTVQAINPNFHGDLQGAFQRIVTGESGYYLPDSERSLALSGDRAAAIELMFPGRPDLKHYAWDTNDSLNLTVFKNSQKRHVAGWNEFGPVGLDGKKQVKRMVRYFDTESEANAFADKISAGNIQAEIAKATPNRDSIRMENAGVAKGMHVQVQRSSVLDLGGGATNPLYKDGKYAVGNIGKVFDTVEAAKAAANLLRQGDVLSMEAPKQDRINLSIADHSLTDLENILKQRAVFAIGGSPVQFVSKLVNALIRGVDKHKKMKDVRTGLEWFDMLTTNTISKNEMRATGMAEFLYANRSNTLTKKELFDYLYVFYPMQGRKTYQGQIAKMDSGSYKDSPNIRTPHNVDFAASRMLYAGRTLKMVENIFAGIDKALDDASDDARPQLEAAVGMVREMHYEALLDAYDKVSRKDSIIKLVNELGVAALGRDDIVKAVLTKLKTDPTKVLEFSAPLLETYRLSFNTAVAKARTEHLAALTGVQLEMGDPLMMDATELTNAGLSLNDWETNVGAYYDIEMGDQKPFGYSKGENQGYSSYTSGVGSHIYTALFTDVAPSDEVFKQYITGLQGQQANATDPAVAAKYQNAIAAATHVMKVRKAIKENFARLKTSHLGAPYGNLLGHLRVTDATVATALPVLSTPGSIFEQLKASGESDASQIPVSFIEELQSDTYQRRTFGPHLEDKYQLYATFKELEEMPGMRAELLSLSKAIEAQNISDNVRQSYIQGFNGGSQTRKLVRTFIENDYASHAITNGGPFLRFLVAQQGGQESGRWAATGRLIPVPKSLQTKLGLPATIPDMRPTGPIGKFSTEKFRSMVFHPLDDLNTQVLKEFIVPNGESMPGFGRIKFEHMVPHGYGEQGLAGLAKAFLALSPEFIGRAAEIADVAVNEGTTAIEKFLPEIDFDALALDWSEKLKRISESADLKSAYIAKFGDSTITREHFRRVGNLAKLIEDVSRIEASEAAFQHQNTDMKNSGERRHTVISHEWDGFDLKFIDRKITFAISDIDNTLRFVQFVAKASGQPVVPRKKVMDTYSLYGHEKDFTVKSPRGVLATTIAFTADAVGITQEQVVQAMLKDDAHATEIGLTPKMILDFATGRSETLTTDSRVLNYLDEMLDTNYDTKHRLAQRSSGTVFRNADYENDPTTGRISASYDAIQHRAKTLMGKTMEAVACHVATLHKSLNSSDDSIKLKERQAELAKKAGLKLDSDGELVTYNMPDSIPHGEDNAYRPILINTYVMNALSRRQNAIVICDARHHRERYSSNGYVNYGFNMGNGKVMMMTEFNGDMAQSAYILDIVRKRGMRNNLIDRIRSSNLTFRDQIEVDGTGKTLGSWLIEAGHEVIDEFPDVFITTKNRASLKTDFGRCIELLAKAERENMGSEANMLGSFANVSEGEDMKKRMEKMKAAPEGLLVAMPYDKTHGYAVNYGAPSWLNEYYYAGNARKTIEAVSHDAFEKAAIAMASDKTYVVMAPNGKVLFEKIATLEEAEERAAQSSKYLGSVPHLTVFLKQYGRVGAYVMEAFMQSNLSSERHSSLRLMKEEGRLDAKNIEQPLEQIVSGSGIANFSKADWNRGKYDRAMIGPHSMDIAPSGQLGEASQVLALERSKQAMNLGPASIPRQAITHAAPIPMYLHAMGISNLSSADEIAAGMARISGFTGPMMVIKPKFPTASHASEMAKLIVDGVSMMSMADMSPEGKAKAASEAFRSWIGDNPELLNKVTGQVASYKPQRKTRGLEQLREAVKYSLTSKESMEVIAKKFGVEPLSLQKMVFRMKRAGVKLPDRPSGVGILAAGKFEQMSRNPETGMLGYPQEVRDSIRMMNSAGESQVKNAKHHGVSRVTVQRILNEPQKARDYRSERTDPTEPYGGPHA